MSDITNFLGDDHRRCDELLFQAEQAMSSGDWATCQAQATAFHEALFHHLQMEEDVLFPAFEQASGITQGPTVVMRGEHQDMRRLADELLDAAARKAGDDVAGVVDTLLILIQQHNLKEENVLYPMAEHHLGAAAADVVERMRTEVAA